MPESYFYAADDEAAWLLVVFHRLPADARARVLQAARDVVELE